ncbi:hypothetical protein [Bacillus wiedmannii]|nr:hypothetical protein [Bacillus wiedmannii]
MPYIAIVGEDERFLGIVTHAKGIGLLQEARGDGYLLPSAPWNMKVLCTD